MRWRPANVRVRGATMSSSAFDVLKLLAEGESNLRHGFCYAAELALAKAVALSLDLPPLGSEEVTAFSRLEAALDLVRGSSPAALPVGARELGAGHFPGECAPAECAAAIVVDGPRAREAERAGQARRPVVRGLAIDPASLGEILGRLPGGEDGGGSAPPVGAAISPRRQGAL